MTATAPLLVILVAVFLATLYAQRLLVRAVARDAREQAARDALEAADWQDSRETPVYNALLDELRSMPLLDAIARMEARRLDGEWLDFDLSEGER